MVLEKTETSLTIYIGSEESESHHITSMDDVSSIICEPPVIPLTVTSLKLKTNYIHPLCIEPTLCKIYAQSTILPPFLFGMIGKRVDAKKIRKKAKSFLDRKAKQKRDGKTQVEMVKPIEWKLEQNSFFATTIFFSCAIESVTAFLSSLNFTNRLSEPNALIGKTRLKGIRALQPPSTSWMGGGKIPILSSVELASVLSLPDKMFGLEMESGTDKTFSNLRGTTNDPADFFADLAGEGKAEKKVADEKEKVVTDERARLDIERAEAQSAKSAEEEAQRTEEQKE